MDREPNVEVPDGDEGAEPRGNARRPVGRDPIRDLLIPVLALGVVVVAILLIQRYLDRGADSVRFEASSGEFAALDLGPVGEGKPQLGEPAPGFRLLDPRDQPVALADFRGRPVGVNFWATCCVPCRKEVPDLVELQTEWGTSVQVVGVNYYEGADAVQGFERDFGINYPLPLDRDGRVTGSYKLTGLPETFFLDAEGIIRDHRIGQLDPAVARCVVAGIAAGEHDPKDCR